MLVKRRNVDLYCFQEPNLGQCRIAAQSCWNLVNLKRTTPILSSRMCGSKMNLSLTWLETGGNPLIFMGNQTKC